MSTKICPNCGAEVPSAANLCKHCFHDFNVVIPPRKSPLFTVLFLLFGMAIVSAAVFGFVKGQHRTYNISVDQETQSIVFTTKYADHTEAERVYFTDVASVEYVTNTYPMPFEVAIVTNKGARHVYQRSVDPLDFQASQLGEYLNKPVVTRSDYEAPGVLQQK